MRMATLNYEYFDLSHSYLFNSMMQCTSQKKTYVHISKFDCYKTSDALENIFGLI